MTEMQKNQYATKVLHEMAMAMYFCLTCLFLLVVTVGWVCEGFELTFGRWLYHVEAFGLAFCFFLLAAAFQPEDSWIQKRFTRLVQAFYRWC